MVRETSTAGYNTFDKFLPECLLLDVSPNDNVPNVVGFLLFPQAPMLNNCQHAYALKNESLFKPLHVQYISYRINAFAPVKKE